jgi:hypothetical protein
LSKRGPGSHAPHAEYLSALLIARVRGGVKPINLCFLAEQMCSPYRMLLAN